MDKKEGKFFIGEEPVGKKPEEEPIKINEETGKPEVFINERPVNEKTPGEQIEEKLGELSPEKQMEFIKKCLLPEVEINRIIIEHVKNSGQLKEMTSLALEKLEEIASKN